MKNILKNPNILYYHMTTPNKILGKKIFLVHTNTKDVSGKCENMQEKKHTI